MRRLLIPLIGILLASCHPGASTSGVVPEIMDPAEDEAPFHETEEEGEFPLDEVDEAIAAPAFTLTHEFCALWNPEYAFRQHRCCAPTNFRGHRRPRGCARGRRGTALCTEQTEAQRLMKGGEHLETLDHHWREKRELVTFGSPQSICTADNGFLAHGVPLVTTADNRVLMNNPGRCAHFGTSGLVLMLHRLGKAVDRRFGADPRFDGVRMVIGDLSAPRGGCLATRRGSHSGHTSGLDADVAFLVAQPGIEAGRVFPRQMDYKLNWWFLRTMAEESPVCIHYVFLDRRHIRGLAKAAGDDPLWPKFRAAFKHIPGHRNHYHFRVGLEPRTEGEFLCKRLIKAKADAPQ